MSKTLEELHLEAVNRIRGKLFSKFEPYQLGLKEASETVRPPFPASRLGEKPSLGGLTYRVISNRVIILTVEHAGDKKFNVFLAEHQPNGPEITLFANSTDFDNLDNFVKRAYEKVMNDQGVS